MEEITNIDDIASEEGFFLPHHGVFRAGNRSRPLRVVFNCSQKTDLDISLNDVLCKGRVIQDDLFSIMLRAKKLAYFFSCDISHMVRQIEIHPHQRHFQKILWKKGLNEPVQIFKLKTNLWNYSCMLPFHTSFKATFSFNERKNFPKAAVIVLRDVYLDDILSGCFSLNELESPKTVLTQLFKSAGMSLHKWCFSHSTNDFLIYTSFNHLKKVSQKTWVFCGIVHLTPFVLKFLLRPIISLRREMCSPRSHVFSTRLVS
ncbi:DUF1758 domain-containing protein [Trichonephila clavipes]|nr:DUF1758 domain-containing protein [Trichonephila clavipes]